MNKKTKENCNEKNNKKNKIKGKKKNNIKSKIIIILLIVISILIAILVYKIQKNGGGIQGILATAMGHNEETVKELPDLYCLLIGQSQNLTDTIMVAKYSPKNQEAALLSIPRDTYIGTNKENVSAWDKINAVYQKSPNKLLRKVNELTGLNIENYIKVDTEAFVELIDAIGGVEFDVPINMDYDDDTQDLHIHLKAGRQKLDGKKSEQLVRFRHNNDYTSYPAEYGDNDLGRMRTQRAFLTEVAKQTLKIENIVNINKFLDIAKKNVESNMDFSKIKDYIPYIVRFNINDLKSSYLPGEPKKLDGVWVYLVNRNKTKEVVNNLFLNSNILNDKYKNENTDKIDTSGINKKNIKIEILNGTKDDSKLEKLKAKLEKEGYSISRIGKTNPTALTTVILRENIDENVKKHIETISGIRNFVKGNSSTITMTIIIGQDY